MTNSVKILLLFFLVLILQACDRFLKPQNQLQKILDAGVLKVGTQYSFNTYYQGAKGPEGLEYELAKGFADHLGVALEVYPHYNRTSLYPLLEQDHIDLIAVGIAKTSNQERFKFAPSYQRASQKLVYKQGIVRPKSPEDLDGKLVIAEGSGFEDWLTSNEQAQSKWRNIDWKISELEDVEELALNIQSGALDYTIVDSNSLAVLRRLHPNLSVGFTVVQEQPLAWALAKHQDDSLLAALVEYFGEVNDNGTLAVLMEKYFGHIKEFNYVDTKAFLQAANQTLPQYQAWFKKYSSSIDWRLLAAMSYQESHWNPKAKSPTGVRGLMMLTLATAQELEVNSRLDPEESIRGGAQYFESLLRRIPERISSPDRIWFALAAYNIGLGHLEDARVLTQKLGGNPDLWIDVKKHLPLLSKKRYYRTTQYGYARGHEALTYVSNIRRYYDSLIYLTEKQP
ncbi:membrane-bound lytic murein transglycosylase MltF [Alteromonas sp. a30]|nr:membrane-bound lytic murein transglycosylase MltF [Alteromonas sp. a30]